MAQTMHLALFGPICGIGGHFGIGGGGGGGGSHMHSLYM